MPYPTITLRPITTIAEEYQTAKETHDDAVITLPVVSDGIWCIYSLWWGYDVAPTGGGLTIAGGGFSFAVPITSEGVGFTSLPAASGAGVKSNDTSDIVITLLDGGEGVTGYLNVFAELINLVS